MGSTVVKRIVSSFLISFLRTFHDLLWTWAKYTFSMEMISHVKMAWQFNTVASILRSVPSFKRGKSGKMTVWLFWRYYQISTLILSAKSTTLIRHEVRVICDRFEQPQVLPSDEGVHAHSRKKRDWLCTTGRVEESVQKPARVLGWFLHVFRLSIESPVDKAILGCCVCMHVYGRGK